MQVLDLPILVLEVDLHVRSFDEAGLNFFLFAIDYDFLNSLRPVPAFLSPTGSRLSDCRIAR